MSMKHTTVIRNVIERQYKNAGLKVPTIYADQRKPQGRADHRRYKPFMGLSIEFAQMLHNDVVDELKQLGYKITDTKVLKLRPTGTNVYSFYVTVKE